MNPDCQTEKAQNRTTLQDALRTLYGGRKPLCCLHSYGCQQNASDGEKIKTLLAEAGYGFCELPEQADLIILNTCAVRETAEQRVYGTVGSLKKLKEQNPALVIGLCGCMAQEPQTAEKIRESYRHVDLVFGTYAFAQLHELLLEVLTERRRVFRLAENGAETVGEIPQTRQDTTHAFVSVMYGCNNFCTYCIVPYVRGREASRAPEDIEREVRTLVEAGYKEITLLGQNVNSYGYGFPALLRRLDDIEGDFRLRFMSSHPKDATPALIDTILESRHVCKHLHLPVQAGSDRILALMNRRYTVADYLKIVAYAREKAPDFSFSTDIIVGFPGETYEEFLQTKALCEYVKYDNIYSFVYSPRRGTKAALLADGIDKKTKGLWLQELLHAQREVAQAWLSRFVGTTRRVLVDGEKEPGLLTGHTDENLIAEFAGDAALIGDFVPVKITGAYNWALRGEVTADLSR